MWVVGSRDYGVARTADPERLSPSDAAAACTCRPIGRGHIRRLSRSPNDLLGYRLRP